MIVRERGRAIALRVLAAAAAAGAAAAASAREPAALAVAAAFAAAAVAFAVLSRQRIIIGADRVELVYPLRTMAVAPMEVQHLAVRRIRSWYGERIARPVAVLADGRVLALPGLQPFRFIRPAPDDFPLLPTVARQLGTHVQPDVG